MNDDVQKWTAPLREAVVGAFQYAAEAFGSVADELNRSTRQATEAIETLNAMLDQMRREHPEWFDLETGYLIITEDV